MCEGLGEDGELFVGEFVDGEVFDDFVELYEVGVVGCVEFDECVVGGW